MDQAPEVDLNIVELGDGVFGIDAASRAYFGKAAAALRREEAEGGVKTRRTRHDSRIGQFRL